MKKILLALLCLPSIALAAQQEITAVPDSPVLPSIGALKDAVNLRLADIDENFDEIYTAVGTRPWVIQATAPADTTLAWFDTDQVVDAVVLKIHNGERWVPQAIGEGGSYTLPTASADTLGGIKVGARLTITDGVLSADVQTGDGDDLGSAAYSDVVALWTTCTGYLKSDGTCDTPSGSATYPSAAGVANWGGSAWGTSYTVGTGASNLVQLNASAQLPAVSGALITGSWTGTLLSGQTTHTGAIQALATELDSAVDLTFSTGLTDTSGTITVTYPVTAEAFSGSGWNGDTGGLARNDAYDYVHLFDTDDDGLPNKVDLSSAGIVKTDADGVLAVATAGTDYMTTTNLATGSTDNAVLRADGTGGKTTQSSGVTIDDNDNVSTTGTLSGKMATVVNSDTASYNVTTAQAQAGTLFLTTNTATTTYNLPAAEAGMTACFSMGRGNSQVLRIDTDGTDFIVKSNRARTGTAGDYYGATASATNKVCVAAYDATDWYIESEVGTWTEE